MGARTTPPGPVIFAIASRWCRMSVSARSLTVPWAYPKVWRGAAAVPAAWALVTGATRVSDANAISDRAIAAPPTPRVTCRIPLSRTPTAWPNQPLPMRPPRLNGSHEVIGGMRGTPYAPSEGGKADGHPRFGWAFECPTGVRLATGRD